MITPLSNYASAESKTDKQTVKTHSMGLAGHMDLFADVTWVNLYHTCYTLRTDWTECISILVSPQFLPSNIKKLQSERA